MGNYVYLHYKGQAEPALSGPPVPVREERLGMVMRNGKVHADALLDELDHFLTRNPEYRLNYAGFIAQLAYVTGMQMAGMGLWEAAAHYLELGSRWSPQNCSVQLNHAVALQLAGDPAKALTEYLQALSDPLLTEAPLPTVLAARCCWALGQWKMGASLLRSVVRLAPRDVAFWEFLAEMEEKAAQSPERRSPPPPPPLADPSRFFCVTCGIQSQAGDQFCRHCGTPLRPAKPAVDTSG